MNQIARRHSYRFGDSTLTLEFGDILSSEAQVVVSSDNSSLTMGGGVSLAIRRAGGNAIALDVAKKIPVALGDVVVTTAGTLQAHYVFHVVTLGTPDQPISLWEIIEKATRRCMQLADALSVRSIAFPPISAGRAGLSYEEVTARIMAVIADELHHLTRPVDVTMYLYSPDGPKTFNPLIFAAEFAKHPSQWQAVPDSAMPHGKPSSDRQVFISYSHKDARWLKHLQTMLKPYVGSFAIWNDTHIAAGSNWRQEIQDALVSAKLAVLLVSPDFLESPFITEHELPLILEAAKKKGLRILWVYLRPCAYAVTPIGTYQAAHNITHPLSRLNVPKREDMLLTICQTINAAMNA
jgi:O-acetyl-ADP-ribose deacetylase (regulator of RNase III)